MNKINCKYILVLGICLIGGSLSASDTETSLEPPFDAWGRKIFKIPVEKFPQILTVEQYGELEASSDYFDPQPVTFKEFLFMKFFYRGEISALDFENKLPKDHFKLIPSPDDEKSITVFEEGGVLSFKLYFNVILREGDKLIEGFKKYGQFYHIKLYGKITEPAAFLASIKQYS